MNHYPNRFQGKRAIVTGASKGIGRATAIRLAREGARVGLISLAEPELDHVAALIHADGGQAIALPADVSQETQIASAIDSAAAQWGGLDIVISNAGIELPAEDGRVDQLPLSVWQRVLNVNLTGQFLTCKHGARHLLNCGGGAIVMTGSPCGLRGFCFNEHAYSASKGGIHSLMSVMALDYAANNIRVNAVVPGFIDTPMNAHVMRDPEQLKYWSASIPAKRPGKPEEVAAVILFLASEEASYVMGATYYVDGGQLA